jgi:diguanylate cyclase (GGDEF)-like protein
MFKPHSVASGRKAKNFFLATLVVALYVISIQHFLLFHSVVEIFSVSIASAVFIVAWNTRRFHDNDYFLCIGLSYLFIAVLDLMHTLTYEKIGVLPGAGPNPPLQFWIAARLLQGLSLLCAPLFIRRRLNVDAALWTLASLFSLALASILYWENFPDCYIEGIGLTPFKVDSEYAVCAMLLAAIVLLYRKRRAFDPRVLKLLVMSIGVSIVSEVAFAHYMHTADQIHRIGHLLKLVSFYLFYKAIIETALMKPYDLLFRNLKQSEEALRVSENKYMALSITDGLTDLFNARQFHVRSEEELERAERYGRPLSLLMLDVDNFKRYNDTYGHPEGDQVLIRLGEIIRSCLRATDSAYRYGGEEFTIFLPETAAVEAAQVAERIRREFEASLLRPVSENPVHMTVSIGVATYRKGEGLTAFVKRADSNLYRAKGLGKNQVFSEDDLRAVDVTG